MCETSANNLTFVHIRFTLHNFLTIPTMSSSPPIHLEHRHTVFHFTIACSLLDEREITKQRK